MMLIETITYRPRANLGVLVMTVPKILKFVRACKECPHRVYDSGGVYECELVGQPIRSNFEGVASFCPLADYPGKIIADQAHTIDQLRDPYRYSFIATTMLHVAVKFKTELSATGHITFTSLEYGNIRLHHSCIITLEWNPLRIFFIDGTTGRKYQLHPDAETPKLFVEVTIGEGVGWVEIAL